MLNKTIYYTLGDIVAQENDSWYPNTSADIQFSTIMTTYGLVIEDSSASKLALLYELIREVYAEFFHAAVIRKRICIYENEEDYAPTASERKEVFREFIGLFNLTAPRYSPLLEQFKAKSSDPIGKIESTSTGSTRFNDTPQDGGDFSDDNHTTHITQSEATTTTDTGSIMERLDALYRNWRSVIREWVYEYRGLFYKETLL